MTEETKSSYTEQPEFTIDIDKSFDMIHKFVTALSEPFCDQYRYLRNFSYLVDKISNDKENEKENIDKVVECFRVFCVQNRDAIINRDFVSFKSEQIETGPENGEKRKKIKKGVVYYSSAAWLPLYELFNKCIEELMGEVAFTMWKYILFISHYVDSESTAKSVLKTLPKTAAEDFLTRQYVKVQKQAEPGNPMATLGSIFQGGAINELLTGIVTNNIQPDKVQDALSGMVGNIKNTISTAESDNPEMGNKLTKVKGLLDALPELIGSLTTDDSSEKDGPDINSITGPAIDLLKDLGGNNPEPKLLNNDKSETLDISE